MKGEPTKAHNLSILQRQLLCRRPFPRPPGSILGLGSGFGLGFRILFLSFRLLGFEFSGRCEPLKWREGTPPKRKTCRLCNARSFSGGHFQGPLDFLDFRLLEPLRI